MTGVSLFKAVRQGKAALRVTWTAPQRDVNISRYQVHYRRSGNTSWDSEAASSGSPPETFTFLPGLDAGTEYYVRVRAVYELGDGEWSAVQTERTFDSEF